jgi:hypothetical protein
MDPAVLKTDVQILLKHDMTIEKTWLNFGNKTVGKGECLGGGVVILLTGA